jgi:hypothetical protein
LERDSKNPPARSGGIFIKSDVIHERLDEHLLHVLQFLLLLPVHVESVHHDWCYHDAFNLDLS